VDRFRSLSADRRFAVGLVAIGLVAFAFRLTLLATIARRDPTGVGDPLFYHLQANFLVDGHGFSDPFLWRDTGRYEPVAIHPPLFSMWLAISSVFGFRGFLAHKVMSCLAGALAVVAIGLVGRETAGRRVGLVAAAIATVYPPLWSIDGQLWPEGLFTAMVAFTVWAAIRLWKAPGWRWAVATGAFLGLAALTRGEGIIVAVALVTPLLLLRKAPWRTNLRDLAVTGVVCGLVIAPWTVRNVVQFEHFVPISTNSDELLVYANNPYAYGQVEGGRFLGFWYYPWQDELRQRLYDGQEPPGDASERAKVWGEHGREYAREHLDRVPVVLAARVGRAWNLYAPFQNAAFDKIDGKSERVSVAGVWAWWACLAASVPALVLLRRRGMTIVPFVGLAATVTISALYAYGGNRFRTPLDLAVIVLAAVTVDALLRRWRRPTEVAVS
jgi:4-amino-4-deoxy-L-arabinose transferase-like glycosyltransferase